MLDDLIAKAKAFLNRKRPPNPTATDAVVTDAFDHVVFEDLLREAPALRQAVEQLEAEYEPARDMFRDTLMQFWQDRPAVRERAEMAESHQLNQAVAEMVAERPETSDTRSYTAWDRYGAAMATLGVSQSVSEYVAEAGTRQKEAEEARKAAQEAFEQAMAALQQAVGNAEQVDPNDPDAVAACEAGVGQSQQQADQAQQTLAEAAAALAALAQQAKDDLAGKVSQSLDKTQEQLEEEGDLFGAAGIEDGTIKRMSFTERAAMADTLRNSKLAKFRTMIGRMRRLQSAYRSRKIEHGRDEVMDVELSGDMSRVLASEILLSEVDEVRELDFIQRLVDGRLLSRKFVGTELAGDGPIVVCIDESGSMEGENEAWAKAFALALYDQARRAGRDLVWIGYSSRSQQTRFVFPKGKGALEDLIAAVEHFYGGGTDFEKPLNLALQAVVEEFDAHSRGKADIVFVSDGSARVSSEFLERFKVEKERIGCRVFGVGVDASPGGMAAFADTLHHVADLASAEGAKDVFASI